MTGPRRKVAARWLPTPSLTARRLHCTSTQTPTMPSMLPLCSPAAAHLATRSNTTSLRPRMRKKRHAHSSSLISPGHLPARETVVRVDPLAENHECLVVFGHLSRGARETESGKQIVEIPCRYTDDPKYDRAEGGGLTAEVRCCSPGDFDQLQIWSDGLCEEAVIGCIAVDVDGA